MKGNETVALAVGLLCLLTALLTLIDWLRHRDRARLDIHLMFATLAGIVLLGQAVSSMEHPLPVLRFVRTCLTILHPYTLLRIVLHFRPISRLVQRIVFWGAWVGCAVVTLLRFMPRPMAVAVALGIIGYFVVVEAYLVWVLLAHSRRTRGPTSWKCGLAAGGSLALAVIVLMGAVAVFVKIPGGTRVAITQTCGSIAALTYFIGFAPPRPIWRSWQLSELHRFLVEITDQRPGAPGEQSHGEAWLEHLCMAAHYALGSEVAVAALWEADQQEFYVTAPHSSDLVGKRLRLDLPAFRQAWESRTPVFLPAPLDKETSAGELAHAAEAKALMAVPIATEDWTWGVLLVLVRHGVLFPTDDLGLLQLMAGKAAKTLKLQEVLDWHRSMVQSAPFAMVVLNAGKVILHTNPRTSGIFGYTAEEMTRQPASLLLPQLEGITPAEAPQETPGRRKDGSLFPTIVRVRQLTMEGRAVMMLTIEDNSARAAAEAEVRERTEQLRVVNKELEAFSYSVSHDLRAPLRAVDGFSRILEEDFADDLPAEARRYLSVVRENTCRMGALIDDLLAFSRLGRQHVKKVAVDMRELVQTAINEVRPQGSESPACIDVGELQNCHADPALLKQVMVNLISNAIKFSRHKEHPRIEIGCYRAEQAWVYFVKDNGAGFDMAFAGKLFGVFQRLHRQEEFEGTGVGLAIVQRVVARHGGAVWADAQLGEGATFYFTLEGGNEPSRNSAGRGQPERSGTDVAGLAQEPAGEQHHRGEGRPGGDRVPVL